MFVNRINLNSITLTTRINIFIVLASSSCHIFLNSKQTTNDRWRVKLRPFFLVRSMARISLKTRDPMEVPREPGATKHGTRKASPFEYFRGNRSILNFIIFKETFLPLLH